MGSAPFDEEGVATRDRELVTDGVLTGYILSSYSARKLGLKTTGNAGGAHNLVVAPTATGGREAMLARLGTGLLVTELMGQGVNGVTGDYSRGAAGFWVENGAIQYPVAEITIAGNLRDMLKDIVAVGDDVDTRGGIRVGSVSDPRDDHRGRVTGAPSRGRQPGRAARGAQPGARAGLKYRR